MRHIYLIRHGRPEFPGGHECCIGRTDLPLSKEGLHQAERLGEYFSGISLSAVYSSTLTRARQTAEAIARGRVPIQDEALREIDCGAWEGLSFDEIRRSYPEQYELRGSDPVNFTPERGESLSDGLTRFRTAIERILSESTGNIAIAAHASVNRALLCALGERNLREIYLINQPYGCVNEIVLEDGLMCVKRLAYMPDEYPDEQTIRALWERYKTPQKVIDHCRAVADEAMLMARQLSARGCKLDERLVFSAALLHDVARAEPNHSAKGAQWISKEGYDKVATVIFAHHELNEGAADPITEKTLVFLADKLISGEKRVSLDERFAESAEKCITEEAKSFHKREYGQALSAQRRVLSLTGKQTQKEN